MAKQPSPKQEASSETTSAKRLKELAQDAKLASVVAKNPAAPPDLLAELAQDAKLASVVAKNPAAPPDLLAELADSDPKALRKNTMGNPATPYETLMKFASQYPEQLLDNPVFDLLFLENPNLLNDIPESALRSMLRREVCPESFLRWASKSEDEEVLLAVAMNADTPQEELEALADHTNKTVSEAVGLHVNLAGELTESWEDVFQKSVKMEEQSEKMEDRHALLYGTGLMPEWLVFQRVLPLKVRKKVASNPDTPVELRLELLQQLAKDEKWAVRREVARNPNTPGELLQQLAKDESSDVRGDVARNPNTPLEAYFYLRLDKNQSVRDSAIGSLSGLQPEQQSCLKELATPFLLQECTKGSPPSLPRLIAMLHPEYPVPALARHFRSSDWRERCAIAQNPSTPPNTLAILAREGNRVVRAAANENLAGQEQT